MHSYSIVFLIFAEISLTLLPQFSDQTLWTSGNYPNPSSNPTACGMSRSAQICDPDSVLTQQNRNGLNSRLKEATRSTQGTKKGNDCAQKGITLYVALADRIQPSSGNNATETDQEDFADQLKTSWQIDSKCKKGLVITLSKSDRNFYMARESNFPLGHTQLSTIFNMHKSQFRTNVYFGLLSVINRIEKEYDKIGRTSSGGRVSGTTNTDRTHGGGYDNRRRSGGSGSGFDFSSATKILRKIPVVVWVFLVFLILSCLCCGCMCYCCCCRKKRNESSQVPTTDTQQHSAASRGGGISSFLGGAGIGSLITRFLPRIMQMFQQRGRGAAGGGGGGGAGYEMDSRGQPPPYSRNNNPGGAGGSWDTGPSQPLYPELPKDGGKGAGGSW